RAGSAEASASKKAAAGVAIGLEPSPSIYSPPDKAEQKRANPNVSAATQFRLNKQQELIL
uniref:hypothetical protein n=1 Tax=Gorillibacterium sp. sgz5001074 TaxID=3446695 RepID=UPI003F67B3ED